MCLAIAGQIKSVTGRKAVVKYPGETRVAMLSDDNVKPGDYVMVQMGIVVKKLTQSEANASLRAWAKVS